MPTETTAPVQLTAANTNRDGTGTLVTVVTPGSLGSYVDQIDVIAPGNVTAGVVRIFTYDGTNHRLEDELIVPATTPSTSQACYRTTWRPSPPLYLPSGWLLKMSTHNAETFNVKARQRDKS